MSNIVIYQKDSTGNHHYKIDGEHVLHVHFLEKDHTYIEETSEITIISKCKAGDAVINNLEAEDVLAKKYNLSTQEEFETALNNAIFNLNLYKYFQATA